MHFLEQRHNYNLSLHLVGERDVDYFKKRKYIKITQQYIEHISDRYNMTHAKEMLRKYHTSIHRRKSGRGLHCLQRI